MNMRKDPNLFVLGLFLATLGAIAAGLLAYANNVTKAPIAKAQLKKTTQALAEVLPKFDNIPANEKQTIKAKNETTVTFYIAREGKKIVGIAGEGYSDKGFSGKVTIMMGIKPSGEITTVIVTEQKETPGLGTVVTDRVRQKTIFDLFSSKKKSSNQAKIVIKDHILGLIRGLTEGDVTKTKTIYKTDTWTALYELDAKAKEGREFREKNPQKK